MRYINLIADPRNNEPLFFPSDMFNKLPITSEGKIRSPFLELIKPYCEYSDGGFADGVQGRECYSEICDCLRCFRAFYRKAHL